MVRHQGRSEAWAAGAGMRGRQVAPETGGGCTGLSANTVCAGVRAVGLSSVKLRLLCSQVLKELLGQGIDYEKILKLTADAKFESGDVKATVAVLSFILSSAAKHSVDGESLSSELQQLGLPKEHAASLCRCYEEKQSPLQKHLRVCSLRKLKQAQTLMSSLG
ncbi:COMM domain-containing protein 4 isoform X8 [Symphalangus syndactylus]